MKKLLLGLALSVMLAGLFSVNSFACKNGCTPGYWKQSQHADSWVGYTPDQKVCEVFSCPPGVELKHGIDTTLLQALKTGGGGVNALMRHAVAALLNAQLWPCEDVGEGGIIGSVNGVLGGSPAAIEILKNQLEDENEDYCPLN